LVLRFAHRRRALIGLNPVEQKVIIALNYRVYLNL
jgi:hypothetical protein